MDAAVKVVVRSLKPGGWHSGAEGRGCEKTMWEGRGTSWVGDEPCEKDWDQLSPALPYPVVYGWHGGSQVYTGKIANAECAALLQGLGFSPEETSGSGGATWYNLIHYDVAAPGGATRIGLGCLSATEVTYIISPYEWATSVWVVFSVYLFSVYLNLSC